MSTIKRIVILISAALAFVLFDISIYQIFTKRYINSTSPQMQAKSVEVDKFLPFAEDSQIVRIAVPESEKLSGELPAVDGAAALFLVYSGFVNAFYPEESVTFADGDFAPESSMQYSNTRGAFQSLAEGRADVIFCAAPSAEQLAYCEQMNVEPELVPIGREAFVFIVNENNPVEGLTSEQIRGIYSGKFTNWSQVGGADRPIDALQRNKGSGSRTTMLAFMGGTPMKRNICLSGSAIGFSFRYYVEGLVGNGAVKMLSVDSIPPDKAHIADGSYPLTSEFYAIYDKNNTNPNVPALIEKVLSPEGQRIVAESGYVPIRNS